MYEDVFEGSKLKLRAKLVRGPKGRAPKCTFSFAIVDGDPIADQKGQVSGEYATCEVTLPRCKDTMLEDGVIREFYTLGFTVIDDDGQVPYPGQTTYRVWPRNVRVTLLKEEIGTTGDVFKGIGFKLVQHGHKDTTAVMPHKPPFEAPRRHPGPVLLVPDVTYRFKEWKRGTESAGREREAVLEPSFEPEFLSPSAGATMEQYVNLQSNKTGDELGSDGSGSVVAILVGAKGDAGKDIDRRNAIPNTMVHVRATFSRDKGRTIPKVGILQDQVYPVEELKGSKDGKTWTCRVRIGDDRIGRFKIELGLAGGETCEIAIGVTPDKFIPETLRFENWRQIWYETWQPRADGADRLTDYTHFRGRTTPGLADGWAQYIDKVLAKSFVRFSQLAAEYFDHTDIPGYTFTTITKSHWLRARYPKHIHGDDDRVLVMGLNDLQEMLERKQFYAGQPNVVSMIWCDLPVEGTLWSRSYDVTASENDYDTYPLMVFPTTKMNHEGYLSHGAYSVTKMKWSVAQYYDGVWKTPTREGDPGWAHRTDKAVELTAPDDIQAHIEFTTCENFKLHLPDHKSSYPGAIYPLDNKNCPVDAGKPLKLAVSFEGVGYESMCGAARQGTIWMRTLGMETIAETILHELGHNMGQGYGSKKELKARGQPSKHSIPGVAFGKPVPHGQLYDDKWGHCGAHCANGLSPQQKKDKNLERHSESAKCLMWGSDSRSIRGAGFCDECARYITNQDLSNIRKNWKA